MIRCTYYVSLLCSESGDGRTWGFSTRRSPSPTLAQSGCRSLRGTRKPSDMTSGAFGPWWAIFDSFLVVLRYYFYVLPTCLNYCNSVFLAGLRAPSFCKLRVSRDAGAVAGFYQTRWWDEGLVSCVVFLSFFFLYIYRFAASLFYSYFSAKAELPRYPASIGIQPKDRDLQLVWIQEHGRSKACQRASCSALQTRPLRLRCYFQ